jgi:hypothetical protein
MDVGYSLKPVVAYNDITNIIPALRFTPKTQKSTHDFLLAEMYQCKGVKVPKYFVCIAYGCRIQSEACGLNNDSTTSSRLRSQGPTFRGASL